VDRRTFLAGTGALVLAAPLTAEAEQANGSRAWRASWFAGRWI
jgi:hypothetical protein